MSDCRFGVSPVNYPDPDPEQELSILLESHCLDKVHLSVKFRR